jgi:4-oxalocrotonate tautomerase
MPEVVVYMVEGRSAEQKRNLLKGVTQALVDNLGVSPDVVTVSLMETPKHLKSKGGVPFSER